MGKGIVSVNPTTGETLRRFSADLSDAVEAKLGQAATAASSWGRADLATRVAVLARAADLFDSEKHALGQLAACEMGKPIGAGRDEAAKCALGCRYYARHAEAFLAPEVVDGPDQAVWYQPLGAILAVMPWNFPFWQVVRFAAPALAAGNVALLKHASSVPQCALALEDLFRRAGAPAGVFQVLLVGSDAVPGLIADDRVAAVTLTGSDAAGREVAAAAGRALKKTVLELGGSDPFVVLESADLERAIATAVKARLVNNGQSCIAAKRFIVADAVADRFLEGFVAAMRGLTVGDPLHETTDVGPLATREIRDRVASQVDASVAAGARLLCGGEPPPGPGWFYPPTVLADVPSDAPAAREEVFGPVAAVFRVAGADQALALANGTPFGLGASVWTRDRGEAERFARDLAAGMVFVNGMVVSDPSFPFGGIKRSGHGRELALPGLREFVNIKTVRINLPAGA
jgi:succinate-semialdehyde dehydrogenase / glutarate-semialdehyde dehydrogenase